MNFDISALVGFRKLLGDFRSTEDQAEVTELLSDDIHKTIQEMVAETI